MRQSRLQRAFHRPAVDDKGIDDRLVACGELVIVVGVRVENLDDGPSAVKGGCHRELQQIIGEKDALTDWDGGMQTTHDSVKVLDRRLEFENRLIVRAELPVEPSA